LGGGEEKKKKWGLNGRVKERRDTTLAGHSCDIDSRTKGNRVPMKKLGQQIVN